MLYHVSPASGIQTLEPQISSHGIAYVYAIENLVTGLLFGVKHDDFDFLIDNDATYRQLIAGHIVDRLIRFDALDRQNTDPRFQKYFSPICDALRSAMDGHLLL